MQVFHENNRRYTESRLLSRQETCDYEHRITCLTKYPPILYIYKRVLLTFRKRQLLQPPLTLVLEVINLFQIL